MEKLFGYDVTNILSDTFFAASARALELFCGI